MSEHSLVVKQGDLTEIEAALVCAQEKITTQVDELMTSVDRTLEEWAVQTTSRAAQLSYQARLRSTIGDLTAALDKVRTALAQVREAAHQTEVDNVAIID